MRRLPVVGEGAGRAVSAARPDPPVRGDRLLELGDNFFRRLDRLIERVLPPRWNPIAQSGAIANTTFLIAAITGVALLLWYSPSVHKAYSSLEAMRAAPLTAQLMRSLHRYSSDACIGFVVVHALRLTFARRFGGARWLAWVTGMFLLGVLWFVGWLGYWLVWDERARQVALGTAQMLDRVPVFADPLSRSFLTDGSINSLLFFMVFFFHMLIPLGMAIPLWLHITRLNRPRFLADRAMTMWILAALVVLSLVLPAQSAAPARMTVVPTGFSLDAWYLLPLLVTDRLGGVGLWAIMLLGGVVLFLVPWWVARGRAPAAVVDPSKCNACRNCYVDCPYNAIAMVPRSDGKHFPEEARVDPDKCVGCGICAGSCDSAGVGLPMVSAPEARARMDRWIDRVLAEGGEPRVAFLCASSAGAGLVVDAASGECSALPGYSVMAVACIGWVHMLTVERAIRHGAKGVLLVACAPSECTYREGTEWTAQRLRADRAPELRFDKVPAGTVLLLELDRTNPAALLAAAAAFARGEGAAAAPRRPRVLAGALGVTAALTALLGVGSVVRYGGPPHRGTELLVSFKHPGRAGENCRTISDAEQAKLPPHMRRAEICERGRAAVRLRVRVDGATVIDERYLPRGLSNDGNSIAIASAAVSAGVHLVSLQLGDTADPEEWTYREERTLTFPAGHRRVVLFDKMTGFSFHGGPP